jgi:AcrR family transcriptional regulator
MPYPAKTTPQAIIASAIALLEASGPAGLSMRTLASALGITPHALYRYFPDRDALDAAIAEASYYELLQAVRRAANHRPPSDAALAAAEAYLAFARAHPARYHLMFHASHDPATKSVSQEAVWQFVLDLLGRITSQPDNHDAALALWALLHGFVALEGAHIAEDTSHIHRGLSIFLAGLTSSPTGHRRRS